MIVSDPKQKYTQSESPNSTATIQRAEPLSEHQIQSLMDQGFTRGLSESLDQMNDEFALRIWIVDNSGSMQKADGNRIIPTNNSNNVKMTKCTRWEEIQECLEYHINLVGLIQAPTRFRLLNNPGAKVGRQQFTIAEDLSNPDGILRDVQDALNIMRNTRPGGCTPLTNHIHEIYHEISLMAPDLQSMGKKVAIVIATDGLPTDEQGYGGSRQRAEFIEALRLLEQLPVWVVVRLCTDEDDVVDFYNNLDTQLELSLEVLDDFSGEAKEVTGENPWLNYALPLHRMREMGYHDRVFDMLDERRLTKTEVRDFCALLFGTGNFDGVADPSLDWKGFLNNTKRLLQREAPQWNPVTKRMGSWMDTKKMNRIYGNRRWF